MSKSFKSFAITLALLALVIAPACHKKTPPVVAPSVDTSPAVPPIPPTVTTATAQTVPTETDFVSPKTDTVAVETLPNENRHLGDMYRAIGEIHEAEGRPAEALEYFKRALDVQSHVRQA